LPFKLIKSFYQVRSIIKDFNPDAVVGVGGYSSFPVLRYAQARGIPSFIHESNSFAGRSNILLGKKATKIFVATDGMEKFFPSGKIKITGNPVRSNIVKSHMTREDGIKFFELDPLRKTIFVTGGSLGAKGINEAIAAGIDQLVKDNIQLIWQTGTSFLSNAKEAAKDRKGIWVGDFITKMEAAFAAADVVVSRSGAMAIAELCVVKKPVVFVPFPFAAEDHQSVNARKLVEKNAGLMVKDDAAKEKLVPTVIGLINNEETQGLLKENIGKLAIINADEIIAGEVMAAISKQ
jgi:UDP-N-acetylglucosamine--N-acetylmuramyl-(pentapeptide) pyrophosphoryl-undecaprenol N-acetylglucosamine transferase